MSETLTFWESRGNRVGIAGNRGQAGWLGQSERSERCPSQKPGWIPLPLGHRCALPQPPRRSRLRLSPRPVRLARPGCVHPFQPGALTARRPGGTTGS